MKLLLLLAKVEPLNFWPRSWISSHAGGGCRAILGAAFISLFLPLSAQGETILLNVRHLLCEYAKDPLGIESPHPRLSWQLESGQRGVRQTAYQILVATSQEKLRAGEGDLWDTQKVLSGQSIQIAYQGINLTSRQSCFWKVRVWDQDDQVTPYSEPAKWEMGLLSAQDWKARWIGYPAGWLGRALYFRHDFTVRKNVKNARAYIAGLGFYELRLNGQKVGDHVLDPGLTDYSKRVLYSTYDITSRVQAGKNTAGIIVGHGWYGIPKLLMQLEITYEDGSRDQIATEGGHLGQHWMITSGPILSNSIYDGESYDARLEKPGWDLPAVPPSNPHGRTEGWQTAFSVEPPGGKLVSQTVNPMKIVQTFRPKLMRELGPGVFVFDAGQNLAGWAELRVKGGCGTKITLKFAENLAANGSVNQENLRGAAATDTYILKGEGEESWEPRFTYHGFRYIQVEGFPGRPGPENLSIKVVRSSVEPAGKLETSHSLINAIQRMVWWTEASNLHSIPTDCPQRDERMGWLNDLTVRAEEAVYNFNLSRFYSKFLDDIEDTQEPDGSITDTAPYRWGVRPADPVSASYLLLAWFLHQHYGDTRAMEKHFDGFKAWTDLLARKTENGIVTYGYYGDWAPPAAFTEDGSLGSSAVSKDTPVQMMSTGYLYYCSRLLARMAEILGKEKENREYTDLARRTAEAFNREYWNDEVGGYGANNQAANSFALFLGLVPEPRISRVVENLARDVEAQGRHLTTGNLCTKYVLEALTAHGKADLAFSLATQESYPSWGFMLAHGATTVWERWEYLTGGQMNSHNHPMMASVSAWFYKYLGGINGDPQSPGFRKIVICPYPVRGLDWVQSEYASMYGMIRSSWKKEAGSFQLEVEIPANCTATVYLPAQKLNQVTEGDVPVTQSPGIKWLRDESGRVVLETGSGQYRFRVQP